MLRGVSPVLFCAATLLTGVSVAAAVATGANLALSLLVGYAAFAATIAMSSRPNARRRAARNDRADRGDAARSRAANDHGGVEARLHLHRLRRLAPALQCRTGRGGDAEIDRLGRALLDAIKAGDLAVVAKSNAAPGTVERERENPHYMTEMTREALRSWADQKGSVPDFLRA